MNNDKLKFRVFNKNIKKYEPLCGTDENGKFFYLIFPNGKLYLYNDHTYENMDDVSIVERCTGLRDKNGNLIYEGDIVRCDRDFDDGRIGLIKKVAFFDGAFCLGNLDGFDWYYINKFHNIEIIGNIHEQKDAE